MGLVVRVVGFRELFSRVNRRFRFLDAELIDCLKLYKHPAKPFNRDTLVRFGLEDSLDYP